MWNWHLKIFGSPQTAKEHGQHILIEQGRRPNRGYVGASGEERIPQWQEGLHSIETLHLTKVWVWQLNLLQHSQDPPDQADHVLQQVYGLFEGLAITSLKQRRKVAAAGLACRLLSWDVKCPLVSLTPRRRDLEKRGSGGLPDWEDTSNSTNTSYPVRQPPTFDQTKPS